MPTDVIPLVHDMALALKVGELDGKLSAVSERQTRHEAWVGTKLDSMDSKLDSIADTLAKSAGRSELMKGLMSPSMWAITTGLTVTLYALSHIAFH